MQLQFAQNAPLSPMLHVGLQRCEDFWRFAPCLRHLIKAITVTEVLTFFGGNFNKS
jgi:hypothetical protein